MFREKFFNAVITSLFIILIIVIGAIELIGLPFAICQAFIVNKWPKWFWYFLKKLYKKLPEGENTKMWDWPLKIT